MQTPEQISDTVAPLQRIAVALSQAAGDVARERPLQVDPVALAGLVDHTLATLLQDRQRRATFLRGLAVRAGRVEGLVSRMLSGDTSYQPGDVLGELVALRSALGIVAELVEGRDHDRAA